MRTPALPSLSRKTDPRSSHLAAYRFTESGNRLTHIDKIVAAVNLHPGMTAGELQLFTGLSHVQIDRRNGDLRRRKLVVFGEERICPITGSLMQTFWPVTKKGRAAA